MPDPHRRPWTRRVRAALWFAGAAGTLHMLASFALDRMREARVKAQRERRDRDLIKSHFTSLLETMSHTLYALLPALGAQVTEMYPVEATSQALQGLSQPSSSQLSTAGTPESSVVLNPGETAPSSSWSSEFQNVSERGHDEMSVVSTNISLPDASVSSGSSDISALESPQIPPPPLPSKKELWRDLKVHSISRALSSAIIIPLLHILTTSQLATLARLRYLDDVKADLPPTPPSPIRGLLHSYTIEGMGLSEFVDETTTLLNPVGLLPRALSRWLPQAVQPAPAILQDHTEDERLYLTYSWWILNEGWKPIAQAVNKAVDRVFAMPLKRELAASDWETLIKQVIDEVLEHTSITSTLPAADAPSPYLASLLDQTRAHLASPDARLLLSRGSENMTARLVGTIKTDVYGIPEYTVLPAQNINKRLVDCLPAIGQWGRDVWQSVPDAGVESVLTMPEFESFAGLIVGDWSK